MGNKPRSKIRGHKRGCGTKKKFDTYDEATKAGCGGLWAVNHAYKCKKCKKFHFGNAVNHIPKMGK